MEYTPKCPYCEINDYVVLEKKFRKAGTLVGGVLERLVVALEVRLLEQL